MKYIYIFITLVLSVFLVALLLFRAYPIDTSKLQHTSRVVHADDGRWLYATTNKHGKWRFVAEVKKLDPNFIKTLIAYEDKRFYSHVGVDPLAIGRALLQLVTNGRVVSGASTITMQLAKLLHPEARTISSKLIEMIQALQLEHTYSKDEILSAYLTLTPYGGNVEGIVAASMRYFGKQPSSLSADEIALLVALPKSPERNRPDRHPKYSKKARDKVLLMAKNKGIISSFEYKQALKQKLPTKLHAYPRYAPHLSAKILHSNDYNSTINLTLQKQLEQWAKAKDETLAKETTIAALVVKNSDATVKAYLGSHYMFSKKVSGYIDMVQAIRSPGSTLKPFIYALGFQKHIIHPNTLILDQETRFGNYLPHNFSYRYNGEVNLRYALQNSLNIPAVKILQRVGVDEFIEHLSSFVGSLKIPKNKASLPIALGGLGMSMWQITQLYVALANQGKARKLHYLQAHNLGNHLKKLFTKKASKMVTSILRDTPAPAGYINTNSQIAYKTGTSYGYRDTWTIAYNAKYTVAIWVGKPNNDTQLKLTGRKTAAPMAFEVFSIINMLLPQKNWQWSARYLGNNAPEGLKYFDTSLQNRGAKFEFVSPRENSRFRSAGCDDAIIEIKIKNGSSPYYWYIDGVEYNTKGISTQIPLTQGAHTINILDSNGETISRDIWVDKPDC